VIIILNGPMNSGKSTIAKLLVQKIPNTVNLEVDTVIQFLDHLETVDVEKIIWENVLALTQNYIEHNLSVVISYVFGEVKATALIEKLKKIDSKVYLFTLNPDQKITLTNRGTREINDQEKERINLHYSQGINTSINGTVLDNSNQTPSETLELILNQINR
jgi:shikimate kinase